MLESDTSPSSTSTMQKEISRRYIPALIAEIDALSKFIETIRTMRRNIRITSIKFVRKTINWRKGKILLLKNNRVIPGVCTTPHDMWDEP